jgi:hypothetical protein
LLGAFTSQNHKVQTRREGVIFPLASRPAVFKSRAAEGDTFSDDTGGFDRGPSAAAPGAETRSQLNDLTRGVTSMCQDTDTTNRVLQALLAELAQGGPLSKRALIDRLLVDPSLPADAIHPALIAALSGREVLVDAKGNLRLAAVALAGAA